jgi:hypothetical protein
VTKPECPSFATRFTALIRFLLGGVFCLAIASKIFRHHDGAAATIYDQWSQDGWMRLCIIGGESCLAFWLLSGIAKRHAGLVVVMVLSAFSGLIIVEMNKPNPKPCGCLDAPVAKEENPQATRRSLVLSLAGNGMMIVGAGWLFLAPVSRQSDFAKLSASRSVPCQ